MPRSLPACWPGLLLLSVAGGCSPKAPATDTARAPSSSASPSAPSASAPAATSRGVTPNGYGAVRVGASVEELSAAIGTPVPKGAKTQDAGCRYVVLNSLPKGMRLMLVNDSVARIEVAAAGVRTAEGAAVGDAEPTLLATYGARAVVSPHKYTGPMGHYVTVAAENDTLYRIIFETDGRTVLRYRAGRRPEVDYVEGCG
jgi:hypothetical protein